MAVGVFVLKFFVSLKFCIHSTWHLFAFLLFLFCFVYYVAQSVATLEFNAAYSRLYAIYYCTERKKTWYQNRRHIVVTSHFTQKCNLFLRFFSFLLFSFIYSVCIAFILHWFLQLSNCEYNAYYSPFFLSKDQLLFLNQNISFSLEWQ